MRFLVLVPANALSEAGEMPDAKLLAEMSRFNESLGQAGMMLAGEGLHPTSRGARIEFSGGKTSVSRGPFPLSSELVAGFWIIRAKSLEEAVDWMKRAPFGEGVRIEIRPIFEMEDFGDALSPELRETERRMRERLESK